MAIPSWSTELVEVGDRAFAYVQAGGGFCVANAGLILSERGPIVIDALFTPAMTRAFQRELAGRGVGDVQLLINTHHHVDHTLGNVLFDAPVLGHASIREEMLRGGIPVERLSAMAPHFAEELRRVQGLRPPTLTFTGEMTLYDGSREIRLLHVGTAHTVGDTLIYLPEDRLLFAGDVAFHYVTPLAFQGHIGNWIALLERIEGMAVERIVPGHGPVGGKRELRELRDYFVLLRDEARRAYDAGIGVEEAIRDVETRLGSFAAWTEAERVDPNVRRLYQEFAGTLDVPMDLRHIAPRPAGG